MPDADAAPSAPLDPYLRRVLETRARRSMSHRRRSGQTRRLTQTIRRADASLLALAIVVCSLLAVAWQSGGYFPSGYLRTGAVAAFGAGGIVILRPPVRRLSREAIICFVALTGFAFWTWVARGWSPAPSAGLADAQRDLVYVAIFAIAVLACGSGRIAAFGTFAVLTAMLTIVVAGLSQRLLSVTPGNPADYRLSYPLTYWNAYGAMAAMSAVLAAGLAADRRLRSVVRGLGAGAAVLSMVGMYLSLSRGAWIAVACGVVLLVLISPRRLSMLASLSIVGGGFGLALMRLHGLPALVDNPDRGSGQISAAHHFTPWLAAIVVACAAAQFMSVPIERQLSDWYQRSRFAARIERRRRLSRRTRVIATTMVLLLAAGGGGVPLARIAVHAWDRSGGRSQSLVGTTRLTSLQTSRHDAYRVAVREWKSAPVFGIGSGGYTSGWYRYRRVNETIINAHSLYLETMAELGLIGLGALLTFIASGVVASVRSRRNPSGLTRGQSTAVIASISVWLVHTGIDWDWQMTSLTGLAIVLIAMLLAPAPTPSPGTRTTTPGPLWRLPPRLLCGFGVCAILCVVGGVYLWDASEQAKRLDQANQLGSAGKFAASLHLARSVTDAPASTGALLTQAYDLQDLGRLRAASIEFSRAARADPSSWSLRQNWALELLQAGDRRGARVELQKAESLNPFLSSQLSLPLARLDKPVRR